MNWRTSSFSADGNCVQVCQDLVAVRDSKNPGGPALTVDLRDLVAAVKADRPNR